MEYNVCVCAWLQGYKVCHLILGLYYSQCLATQTASASFTPEDFLLLCVTLTLPFYHSVDSIAQTDSTHTRNASFKRLFVYCQTLALISFHFFFSIGVLFYSDIVNISTQTASRTKSQSKPKVFQQYKIWTM